MSIVCYLHHKKDSYVKYVDVLIDMEVSIVSGNSLVQNRLGKPFHEPMMTMVSKGHIVIYYHNQLLIPDSKVHGANMGPIWGRQDPGGPHVGPMNLAIWDNFCYHIAYYTYLIYIFLCMICF